MTASTQGFPGRISSFPWRRIVFEMRQMQNHYSVILERFHDFFLVKLDHFCKLSQETSIPLICSPQRKLGSRCNLQCLRPTQTVLSVFIFVFKVVIEEKPKPLVPFFVNDEPNSDFVKIRKMQFVSECFLRRYGMHQSLGYSNISI